MKTIGTTKSVACFIVSEFNGNKIPIICKFNPDTSINVSIETSNPLTNSDIDTLINENVNPIIDIIKNKLEQSGFQIPLFTSINSDDVIIQDLTYSLSIDITQNINLNNNIGCISSLFNIERGDLRKGILMRFKRVTNFSEMESTEAYILDLYKQEDITPDIIIQGLIDNFSMSESSARSRVAEVLRATDVVKTLYKSKQVRSRTNPGFLTKMELENFSSTVKISVNGIDNINYLLTIPVYLDSILRITQNPESTRVSSETINELCLKKEIIEKQIIDEIEASKSILDEVSELDIEDAEKTKPVVIGEEDDEDDGEKK